MSKKRKKIVLDEFHYHEALEKAHLFNCIINEHLTNHIVVYNHPEIKEKLEKVEDLLGEVYQMIGTLRFELFHPTEDADNKQSNT